MSANLHLRECLAHEDKERVVSCFLCLHCFIVVTLQYVLTADPPRQDVFVYYWKSHGPLPMQNNGFLPNNASLAPKIQDLIARFRITFMTNSKQCK